MPIGHGPGSKRTQFKPLQQPLSVRFAESYIPEPNSGCWIWLANCDTKGYGRIKLRSKGKAHLAHRVSYFLHTKTWPKQFVLHHCDNSYCVNPDHLYSGTQKDNMADRSKRQRGTWFCGEASCSAKLTEQEVRKIRIDPRSQHKIATAYNISQTLVWRIKHRKLWKRLK